MAKRVSLVVPMYNDSEHLTQWIESFRRQTVFPDEILVVDGGSIDGSPNRIKSAMMDLKIDCTVIIDERLNLRNHAGPIGAARNIGIEKAKYKHIVCTDLGVVFSENWFEGMLKAFDLGNLVKGRYLTSSNPSSRFNFGVNFTPSEKYYLKESFLPSSRSIGFTKSIWFKAGGYPDNSYTAEDTVFALKCARYDRFIPVPYGHVEWLLPVDEDLAKKIQNYAKGDRIQRLFTLKYLVKTILWRFLYGKRRFIWMNEVKGYWGR